MDTFLNLSELATALGIDERIGEAEGKVQKQRRLQSRGNDGTPIDDPVEGIELAGVAESVQNKGCKAEDVEVS